MLFYWLQFHQRMPKCCGSEAGWRGWLGHWEANVGHVMGTACCPFGWELGLCLFEWGASWKNDHTSAHSHKGQRLSYGFCIMNEKRTRNLQDMSQTSLVSLAHSCSGVHISHTYKAIPISLKTCFLWSHWKYFANLTYLRIFRSQKRPENMTPGTWFS